MKTILVVDDDDARVATLTNLLELTNLPELEGRRVAAAENGKDGLAQLVNEKPDLLLTNHRMPLVDGLDLVHGAHALPEFRSLPMVMMSTTHEGIALSARTVGYRRSSANLLIWTNCWPSSSGSLEKANLESRPAVSCAETRPGTTLLSNGFATLSRAATSPGLAPTHGR